METMDTNELIRSLSEFFSENYHGQILEQARKQEYFLSVDFAHLIQFEPEIADMLLDQPDEVLKAAEIAIGQIDIPGERKPFIMRVHNLPESRYLMLRNIRSHHLNKMFWTRGVVRNKSEIRPHITNAKFECPSCGNIISILQIDKKFKEPSRCSCGRKGRFRVIGKELVDAQGLILEEVPEEIEGGEQPKRMKVFLKNDLVSPIGAKKTNPGSKIHLYGQIKEVIVFLRTGGQSTEYDLIFEANYVETTEEDFSQLVISPEEEARIQSIGNDPNVGRLVIQSIAPSIYGHERIKEALFLQLMGGVRKKRTDGVVTRGDIHMLLIGDPGAAKSQMLKRISVVAPKSRYVTGKGATGAGLAAAVVKDEFLQGWSLEAGALVLGNKGIVLIDELDKMNKDDANAMHEALEQQTITISKANIQATLRCETSVLAAANPKFGRFDPYMTVAEQIELAPTLLNRFDLIFPIKDMPDPKTDEKMAQFILELHQNVEKAQPPLDTAILRKFIAYARQHYKPKLDDSAMQELKEYYIRMRSSGKQGEGVKSIPISARQLEGLVRLTEAAAKMRLSHIATKKDAKRAIELADYCLRQIAYDEETGTLDIDRFTTGMPASTRNKMSMVRQVIGELVEKIGKTIPLQDVVQMAREKGMNDNDIEEAIEKMKQTGDIFEPRRGFVSKM